MNDWVETLLVGIRYVVDDESLANATKSFRRGFAAFSNVAAGIAAVSTAAAGMAIRQAMAQDETAKLAATMRTTTEELTALQYAAERSGLEQTVLEESMRRLVAVSTQAAEGTGPAAEAFRDIGVAVQDADGKMRSPAELLPEIAAGLETVGDDATRSAAMLAIFGESSAQLEGFLGQGGEAIDELTKRAHEMGFVLDSEAAKNSEALNDAILDLKRTLGVFGRALGDVIIPHLTDAATAMTEWLSEADSFVRVGLDRSVDALSWALEGLHSPLGMATAGLVAFGAAAKTISLALPAIKVVAGVVGGAIGALSLPVVAVAAAIAAIAVVVDELIVTAQGGDSMLRRLADTMGIGEEVAKGLADAWTILSGVVSLGGEVVAESVRIAIDGFWDLLEVGGKVLEWAKEAFPPIKALADAIGSIASGIGDAVKGFGSWLAKDLSKGAAEVTAAVEGDEASRMNIGDENAGLGIASALLASSARREKTGEGLGRGDFLQASVGRQDAGLIGLLGGDSVLSGAAGMGAAAARMAAPAAAAPGSSVQTSASVTVQSGPSREEVARAASDEVYRSTIRQTSAVEGLR